jgi:hypothetical protein
MVVLASTTVVIVVIVAVVLAIGLAIVLLGPLRRGEAQRDDISADIGPIGRTQFRELKDHPPAGGELYSEEKLDREFE